MVGCHSLARSYHRYIAALSVHNDPLMEYFADTPDRDNDSGPFAVTDLYDTHQDPSRYRIRQLLH